MLDCPPLIPLVDGRALAEYADQIVLALAWDKTPREAALDAVELLAPVRDRILGTVLTRVDMHRLRHYDYCRRLRLHQTLRRGRPEARSCCLRHNTHGGENAGFPIRRAGMTALFVSNAHSSRAARPAMGALLIDLGMLFFTALAVHDGADGSRRRC